jgi:cytosine/adenosine deaminase-related metal-dependent hydrolase
MIVGPATIVGGGSSPQIQPHAALRIVGAHVAAFGPFRDVTQAFPDDAVWDTGHRIVLPGLINACARPAAVFAEGLAGYAEPGDGGAGNASGADDAAPSACELEDALDPEALHVATVSALAAGLRHGVTTSLLLVSPLVAGEAGLEAVARAVAEVKARALVAIVVDDRRGPDAARALLEAAGRFVAKAQKGWGDRLRAMVGVGPLHDVSAATLARAAEVARELKSGVLALIDGDAQTERDANARHGMSSMARLVRAEVLDPRAIVVSAHALGAADWGLLQASGATWVATPREDAEERGVALDYVALAEQGLVPALGTGGLTPHVLGEGEALYRGARMLQRPAAEAKRLVAEALFDRGPALAQAAFVPALGSLLPGSPADLVALDVFPATPLGPENWTDHLVQSLATARVHSAMVAGELLLTEGRTVVVDERELQTRARAVVHRLWPRLVS